MGNGHASCFGHLELSTTKSTLSMGGVGKSKAMRVSGEDDVLAYCNGSSLAAESTALADQSPCVGIQHDSIAFGALEANRAEENVSFSDDNDEFDLDRPTEGFSSIPEAVEDIRQGKVGGYSLKHFNNMIMFSFFLSVIYLFISFGITDGSRCG